MTQSTLTTLAEQYGAILAIITVIVATAYAVLSNNTTGSNSATNNH